MMMTVVLAAAVAVLLAYPPAARSQIQPPPRPSSYDCPLRELAYNRSLGLLAGANNADAGAWPGIIHDALFLSQCRHSHRHKTDSPHKGHHSKRQQQPPPAAADCQNARTVYVAPHGSDEHGDGSPERPFASLQRALVVTATLGQNTSNNSSSSSSSSVCQAAKGLTVLLQPGVYFSPTTVSVGPQPVSVTIAAADPQNRPVLSGAVALTNLTFKQAGPGFPRNARVARLPESVDLSHVTRGVSLFVDGKPYVAARWPNANPAFDLWPAGYASGPIAYTKPHRPGPRDIGTKVDAATLPFPAVYQTYEHRIVDPAQWHVGKGAGGAMLPPSASPPADLVGGIAVHWDGNTHPTFRDQWMNYGYFITEQSEANHTQAAKESNATGPAQASSFGSSPHPQRRARVSQNSNNRRSGGRKLTFGRGGWQGTNADTGDQQRLLYVFNAKGALDVPGEFWIDAKSRQLFIVPNNTALNASTTVSISQVQTVLSVAGTARRPVRGLTLRDLVVWGTHPTFMEEYEQPFANTAGWSFYRGAAVEMEGVEDAVISGCTFHWLGGNALLLSGRTHNVAVRDSDFAFLGDSGILALGRPHIGAGIWPDFPNATTVERCLFHDLGLIGKQVAGFSQYVAAHTRLTNIVAFNLPRAAVNWGDAFRGGNTLTASVLFACVRESADHGAFNSWAREPMLYVDEASGGDIAVVPKTNTISKLLVLGAGGTLSNLDHDDGSLLYNDTDNVLAYAPAKNFLGTQKTAQRSLFVFPDLSVMRPACYMDDGPLNSSFGEAFVDNTCLLRNSTSGTAAWITVCNSTMPSACATLHNNAYHVPSSMPAPLWKLSKERLHLAAMQRLGLERNSTVIMHLPSPAEVIAMAKRILDM